MQTKILKNIPTLLGAKKIFGGGAIAPLAPPGYEPEQR